MGAALDTDVRDLEEEFLFRDLDFGGFTIPKARPIRYAPDPVIADFQADNDSFVRMIMGPIGSGKSTACVIEILKRVYQQRVNRDGVRRSKWAIIRQTAPMLKSTTIPTWLQWCKSTVVYDSPIRTFYQALLPDGTRVELLVYFLAMEHSKDVEKVMSLELTGLWMNEIREIPKAIVDGALGRVGRFPSKREGGFNWSGAIADTNPPPQEHWYRKLAEVVKPPRWRFYRQPGALLKVVRNNQVSYIDNPAAEGVSHQELGYEYWRRQLGGKDPDWIQVYVLGEYGSVFTGMPVYGEWWSATFHVSAKPLEPYRGLPLYFGWDFGLTPAVVVFQVTPRGQARVLREFCCPDGGLQQFCQQRVLPALARDYPGMQRRAWGDPAGAERAQANEEITCIGTLNRLGFNCLPAPVPSNHFEIRRDAVIGVLSRVVDGEPGLLVDPSCTMLIRGFAGGYQFARVRVMDGEETFRYVPNKNQFSHIHDALQYGILGACSAEGVVATAPTRNIVQPPETWGGI